MMEWSMDMAIPMPIAIPAMTKSTASLKLSDDAVILEFPLLISDTVYRPMKIGEPVSEFSDHCCRIISSTDPIVQ
jgi:hypothetical protein